MKPPAEWATSEGRKAIEKIHPCSHLTMYVKVRIRLVWVLVCIVLFTHGILLGRPLGSDEGAKFDGSLIHQAGFLSYSRQLEVLCREH